MREKKYSTSCGDITYWISESFDNSKYTLLLLPGLTADRHLFDKQIEYFETKYNIFVWDAPAHASSRPFTLDFDLEDKARWLNEIIDKEGIEKPIIIGQSMGGYVGQMFCELFPDKLKGFVSIDSAPLQKKYMTGIEIWLLKKIEPIYRLYPWKILLYYGSTGVAETEYGIKLMREMMMFYNDDPKNYIKLVGHGYRILAEAIEANLNYEVKCPMILLCGDKDRAGYTKRYNREWHKNAGLPLYWVKGAGHNSNTDNPEFVNRTIAEFIESLE